MGMMGWNRAMEAAYSREHPLQQGLMGSSSGAAAGWRKGPWTPEEDKLLSDYVSVHGEGRWSSVAKSSGLNRSGKSCRLRWVNYLRPGLKRSQLTPQEEGIIIELHSLWGNKWSTIARYLPGRTDNEIKNYWRTHFKKKDSKSSVNKKSNQPPQRQNLSMEEDDQNAPPGSKDDDASPSAQVDSSTDNNQNNNSNNHLMICPDQEYDNPFSYSYSASAAAAAATSSAVDDQAMYEQYAAATWTYHVQQPEERNVELWTGLWNLDDNSPPSGGSTERPIQAQAQAQTHQTSYPLFFGE